MYQILNDLLSDKKGDIIFKVLGINHLIYLAIWVSQYEKEERIMST